MKTIKIMGKPVKVSFSPYSLIVYKQQFGVEPLDVVIPPLYNLCSILDDVILTGNLSGETMVAISTKISEAGHINLYGILWAFIKTADESTSDFYEWMKELEELPILDILYELAPHFISSMLTKKKSRSSDSSTSAEKLSTEMIVTAITQRGLSLSDLKMYTIGGIIDYIVTWNNMMSPGERQEEAREATNDDIRRFKSL